MNKIHIKMIISLPILLLSLIMVSCTKQADYFGTYWGVHPPIQDTECSPPDIFIEIDKDHISLGLRQYAYKKMEEDADRIVFQYTEDHNGEPVTQNIGYYKEKDALVILSEDGNSDIVLIRHERYMEKKVKEYVPVELKADLSTLTEKEQEMLPHLFKAAQIIDDIYWMQAFGNKEELLAGAETDATAKYMLINYGPWDRLNANKPFLPGYGPKPKGANFYPSDMTMEEFKNFEAEEKSSLYTLLQRDETGNLVTIPYHQVYKEETEAAASHIRLAAELAEEPGLKKYLELRAEALLTDEYLESDMAWMDMKDNTVDFVVGPIETYEDGLLGYKAAHESFLLLKDKEWSNKLNRFAPLLPVLQNKLPVEEKYKQEVPGSDSDLGVYNAIYCSGDCNAGSKTIAINLPNDERVHAEKGSRKLQLKNLMRYKFEKILVPISKELIAEDQRQHIKFEAFFENTMFHEVAHGIGIRHTINDRGTVRKALKEQYSALEEGKADVLGLFMVTQLADMGELGDKDLMDNYVTFMAGIFRSVRFGVASSHGKANMIRFYYFQETEAFTRDESTGTYRVDFEKMKEAMNSLAQKILIIQGNGDYDAAKALVEEKGFIRNELQADLDRLKELNIPVDLVFEQGPDVAGLTE